eukprot:Sspe_Gene.43527::Locus_21228_Transcript_1_3_Confidence_0.778_Length_552::g.43527::m.43527
MLTALHSTPLHSTLLSGGSYSYGQQGGAPTGQPSPPPSQQYDQREGAGGYAYGQQGGAPPTSSYGSYGGGREAEYGSYGGGSSSGYGDSYGRGGGGGGGAPPGKRSGK